MKWVIERTIDELIERDCTDEIHNSIDFSFLDYYYDYDNMINMIL